MENVEYQRIEKIKARLNFYTDKRFAETIGVSPQNFYDIRKGKKPISKFVAEKIVEKYPEFSLEYVLYGKGEMLANNSNSIATSGNQDHHIANDVDMKYVQFLEKENARLFKRNEELWQLLQKYL